MNNHIFHARLSICKKCEFWQGVCLKGHVLKGNLGCPIEKFEGMAGAGYLISVPVPTAELPAVSGPGCGGCKSGEGDVKPLTWAEVWRHLMAAMEDWKKAGFAVVPPDVYRERIRICRYCPKGQYKWFQCRQCRCIVYSKAKLATENCPYDLWPKLKAAS